jgi:hypothetical protein
MPSSCGGCNRSDSGKRAVEESDDSIDRRIAEGGVPTDFPMKGRPLHKALTDGLPRKEDAFM